MTDLPQRTIVGIRARSWVGAGLASLFLSSVGWVLATRRIPDSADQAIVGLMGIHILEGRGHPVFYFGSTYGGSFEAHLAAGAFALFGASTATYRGVLVLLAAAILLSVWWVARASGGRRSACWAVAYLALPPFFFLYKVLTSDGHYASACLIASGIVGSAIWYFDRLEAGGPLGGPALGLGLAGGLGLWISPVTPPVFAAALIWLGVVGFRRVRLRPIAILVGGFASGSFPWWLWNARHEWASLAAPEVAHAAPAQLLVNVRRLFSASLPILLGASAPQAALAAVGLRLGAMVVALIVVALAIRRAYRGHSVTGLLVWVLAVVAGVAVLPARFDPAEPRFLVPAYVLFAPLFGAAVSELIEGGHGRRALAAALVAAFAGVHVQGLVSARRHLGVVPGSSCVTGPIGDLVAELRRLGITRAWTSYWASYRITFESRERVVAAPFGSDEWYRWEPYQTMVMEASDPAVVLLPDRARMFEAYLAERRLKGQTSLVSGFTIFTGLEPSTVDLLRRARSLPMPQSAYRVEWIDVKLPARLSPGAKGILRARYRNAGSWDWSGAVHLGARLEGPGPSGPRREIPSRGRPPGWTAPGRETESELEIVAPTEPGAYRVEVDLVHECVDWFATLGGSTKTIPLEVR